MCVCVGLVNNWSVQDATQTSNAAQQSPDAGKYISSAERYLLLMARRLFFFKSIIDYWFERKRNKISRIF